LYLQIQGNCPFKANDVSSGTGYMIKLGIQTDTQKKSSAALYMARHQKEVVR
jgi:hypothetical protein